MALSTAALRLLVGSSKLHLEAAYCGRVMACSGTIHLDLKRVIGRFTIHHVRKGCQPAFRVGTTEGTLSVSDRSKRYLVPLKVPRKSLTILSLQICQGSGVGSIPIGRSIISATYSDCIFSVGP